MAIPTWGTVGPRGSEIFCDDAGAEWEWARCHKAECPGFICRRLSDVWCWVHADGSLTIQEVIDAAALVVA